MILLTLVLFVFNATALYFLIRSGSILNIPSRIKNEENILEHEHRKYAMRFDKIHYPWIMSALKMGWSKERIEKQVDEIENSI
tara:strand:+ start:190 stop:438 length:249 start_codon:yes stop_codon:yes gene_type:complete